MKKRCLALLLMIPLLFARAAAQLSLEEMTESAAGRAQFTMAGIEEGEYLAAISLDGWIEIVSAMPAEPLSYDLLAFYTYQDIEDLLLRMASHPLVHLTSIGLTAEGRRIYSVCVGTGEEAVLLTGSIAARETAGTSYILRQLCALITAAEEDPDGEVAALLRSFTVVAIPCCNPDGRAILDEKPYLDWRANANGVELGMNFPTSEAGQFAVNTRLAQRATEPGASDYPGPFLGSEPETRAIMGWLEHYIDSARLLIDYEQYGRHIRCGFPYLSASSETLCSLLAEDVCSFLTREGAEYSVVDADDPMRGWSRNGIRQYALELANGLVFSEPYGRLGLETGDGIIPLCLYGDLDSQTGEAVLRNPSFAAVTIEISTKGGMEYHENARRNQNGEYENCGYEGLLPHLLEFAGFIFPLE